MYEEPALVLISIALIDIYDLYYIHCQNLWEDQRTKPSSHPCHLATRLLPLVQITLPSNPRRHVWWRIASHSVRIYGHRSSNSWTFCLQLSLTCRLLHLMVCFNSNAHILECLLDYRGHQLVWTPKKRRQTRGTTSWPRPKRGASTNRGNTLLDIPSIIGSWNLLATSMTLQLPCLCSRFHFRWSFIPFTSSDFSCLLNCQGSCWWGTAQNRRHCLSNRSLLLGICSRCFPCNQRWRNMEEKIEHNPGGCWRQPCNDLFWNRAVRQRAHDGRSFANLFKRRMICH